MVVTVQFVLGLVALVAGGLAAWLMILHRRTAKELTDQLGTATARLEQAAAATQLAARAEARSEALAGAVEALPLGVVITGPDGQELFRNEAAATIVGSRPADALATAAMRSTMAAAAGGEPQKRPLELHGPPLRTLSLTGVPLPGGAAAVIIEDVSERRRLDAVRRDFVANVSHELKTPVAALGLLAETIATEDDLAVVRRLVGRMQDEAFRVNRIIEDLLDLSRLEDEPMTEHEPLPVEELLSAAAEHVRPAADFRRIWISVVGPPRSWSVLGDRRQLVSALTNLLENAVKYSEEGSEVEVRARTDGTSIALEVQDRGIGIPSRELERVFERFYRVDRGRGRDTGGVGLGLSIVRHVATNHGGEIQVSSVEGEGSVFTLTLPAAPGPIGLITEAG